MIQQIPDEFFSYLKVNGYRQYFSEDNNSVSFIKDNTQVYFKNDRVSFLNYYDGSDDEAPDFVEYGHVDGLCQLDMFKFQLMCHCFDVVSLKKFFNLVKTEIGIESAIAEIFNKLSPAHLPECY